ncbi:MAG: hypothetical protein AAFZ09_16920, partial [Pseudomonadota bacterium]
MPETGSEGAPGAFLFLQGPLTRFYAQIAERLMAMGRRVVRVNFCGADAADWPHPGAIAYTGTPADWPAFLEQRIAPLGIATVVLHGDRRFYHRHAAAWARRHGQKALQSDAFISSVDFSGGDLDAVDPIES